MANLLNDADQMGEIVAVKWRDSNCVLAVSTAYGKYPVSVVKRWSKIDKKYIEVECPKIITEYNKKNGRSGYMRSNDRVLSILNQNQKVDPQSSDTFHRFSCRQCLDGVSA